MKNSLMIKVRVFGVLFIPMWNLAILKMARQHVSTVSVLLLLAEVD